MKSTIRRCRGYSLIELLVVLVIVGILAMVGVTMIGNRPSGSVRAVLDELEGTISSAHKLAVSRGRDVNIVTSGDWAGGLAAADRLILAFGDTLSDDGTTVISNTTIRNNGFNQSEAFRLATNAAGALTREHMHAGIVVNGSPWWATARIGSQDIGSVEPFASNAAFGIFGVGANNLFQGGNAANAVGINGASKRFNDSFWIGVVGLRNGTALGGGPMGVLVVLNNGATIYKYYNPGILDGGNGQWRKI